MAIAVLALPGVAMAQDIGSPDSEAIKGLYPGKTYSPYAQRSFPSHVYWGETHLHTGLSLRNAPTPRRSGTHHES